LSTVGLPDSTVRESRDRVRAAIRNAGLESPIDRITVNLAPADLRKGGAAFEILHPGPIVRHASARWRSSHLAGLPRDAKRPGNHRQRRALLHLRHQLRSTIRRESGILVHVHLGLPGG
jgi:hypothetical protein